MMKKVLVPLAHGVEEFEFISITDVLRRALCEVDVAAIGDMQIIAANKARLHADISFSSANVASYDGLVIPGGSLGAENFSQHGPLVGAIKEMLSSGKLVAAICASPALVLSDHGFLDERKATCYPSLRSHVKHYVDEGVVTDSNVITGQGPGFAVAFALTVASYLQGEERANKVAKDMLVKW